MSFKNLLKVSANIAKAATSSLIVELDVANQQMLVKQWFFSKFLLKQLHKRGQTEVKRVFLTHQGINIEHDIFGIIGIIPKKLSFTQKESIIYFDVILFRDKIKDERDKTRVNSIIQGVAGGLLTCCTFGFAGGGLIAGAVEDFAKGEIDYLLAGKFDFFGNNQSISLPSPVILDPNTNLKELLAQCGGELSLDLIPYQKAIAISTRTLTQKQLDNVKQNLVAVSQSLISTNKQLALE